MEDKAKKVKCPYCGEKMKTVSSTTYYGGTKCFYICEDECLKKEDCEQSRSDDYS